MEFKTPYILAMREQDPQMFMALRRSGKLEEHVQQASVQAHAMLADLLKQEPKGASGLPRNPEALRRAEEIVLATLIEFPEPLKDQRPEPPDDLPGRTTASKAPTIT